MDKWFAISDIHGMLPHFKELLTHWNHDNEQLVILGDLVDRGYESKGVIQLAQQLKETYGAVVLGGNHDQFLVDWLDAPEDKIYYEYGGDRTVDSFFSERVARRRLPHDIRDQLLKDYSSEMQFMRELETTYETDPYIFVHAGLDLYLDDWRDTSEHDCRWIRFPFFYGENLTGKTIVFGHTPTRTLNLNKQDDIWLSRCNTKIGIDGGAVYGGHLNGLKLNGSSEATAIMVGDSLQSSLHAVSLNS